MEARVHNFSAGPSALPLPALEEARDNFLVLPGAGASVMEISHRSKTYDAVHQGAKANIAKLLNLPANYKVLFIQGGASTQFCMIPMNFLRGTSGSADYLITGSWGSKALKEAKKEGSTKTPWNGKEEGYVRFPKQSELKLDPSALYCHVTSNETIEGVEMFEEVDTGGVPMFCDASSNFLSRPIPAGKYGMIYAGAQKNLGPAGVAVVVLREDLLDRIPEGLPSMLDYKVHAGNDSLYNTPPCFAIYMIYLVTKWLLDTVGGLDKIAAINKEKARILYETIDGSGGYYRGHAKPESRSLMNVTWRLPSEELEQKFVKEATAAGLHGLKGHRSVGGLRASIYNAVGLDSVKALVSFMKEFHSANG